jgi:MoaA/NifB/PqqE/SkfB family radical SAM enzyme
MYESLEIGLVNKCQLKCPLCSRNKLVFKENSKFTSEHELDYETLCSFIRDLGTIKHVELVGATTEPTLYYKFLEFIQFLKELNIKVTISTNGMSDIPWEELNLLLVEEDEIKWAIDGSTQKMHKRYRRGSILAKVLNHRDLVTSCRNTLQFILFEHNQQDLEGIKELAKQFDGLKIDNCYTSSPPLYKEDVSSFKPVESIETLYSTLRPGVSVSCKSKSQKELYLNYIGEVFPCCHLDEANISSEVTIYTHSIEQIIAYTTKESEDRKHEVCGYFCSNLNRKIFNLFKIDP